MRGIHKSTTHKNNQEFTQKLLEKQDSMIERDTVKARRAHSRDYESEKRKIEQDRVEQAREKVSMKKAR